MRNERTWQERGYPKPVADGVPSIRCAEVPRSGGWCRAEFEERFVGVVERRATEVLTFRIMRRRDIGEGGIGWSNPCLEIRVFASKDGSEWTPARHPVPVRLHEVSHLVDAIAELRRFAAELGLSENDPRAKRMERCRVTPAGREQGGAAPPNDNAQGGNSQ
jgi:hypothetical protein